MSDWPFLLNFFLFVIVPSGIVFVMLFCALYCNKDDR